MVSQPRKSWPRRPKPTCIRQFSPPPVGSVAGAPGRQQFDNTYFPDQFNHAYGGFYAGAQWHLDFGIRTGKLDEARAEYQKMLNTQDYARRQYSCRGGERLPGRFEEGKASSAYSQAAVGARKWIVAAFSNFDLGIGTSPGHVRCHKPIWKKPGKLPGIAYIITILHWRAWIMQSVEMT